ncbi:3-oxoacyl-ACP synthase III family protein [Flagellimonas meridianipacifica]|uniref:3-oxoacyl-[acyl-carrier-protein] synthase-3 n=1 Tax=Flagellimonas meridianipacifica TaxID=1080225 RepID=A0A2T0MCT0_9FLAO|nr:ketoacyl-ACP synthase III [Allomuricauda pacifica]PRX55307.1 3-oxoacyl-[acyl-carrier-protein] synthase-3 [Allomuricauda pacifica]
MNLKFTDKKITGILTVFPEKEIKFDDEIDNYEFTRQQSMKLKLVMGFNKRRVVKEGTAISDLCVFGLNHLFEKNLLKKEDIDALILVTQSPDHFMPSTSHIIHGKLGLKQDIYCSDINQGCAGYSYGLNHAFMLLEQEEINKVVVLNADILSIKVSNKDRSSGPLTGDGATITIVEKNQDGNTIYGSVKSDGSGASALIIPAGGFKQPSNEETGKLVKDKAGNYKALDHIDMKGDEVFNFVQREVPPMIDNLLEKAGTTKEDIDYFMFHQPNKFMVKQLANAMGVPNEKMPNNLVENFGNSASVTIPALMSFNLGEKLKDESYKICLCGFGNGLSWSSLVLDIGHLDFCETIDYNN